MHAYTFLPIYWLPLSLCIFYRVFRSKGRIPSSPSIFTSDEYRQWLSRTPSTSAIYEQIRASRDVLNQQRAARFTYSAENIHAALKDVIITTIYQLRSITTITAFRLRGAITVLMVDPAGLPLSTGILPDGIQALPLGHYRRNTSHRLL